MFALEDCVSYLTNKSATELARILEGRMSDLPVTRIQWKALYYINRNGLMTQKELAEAMGHKEAGVARLLDRMEKEDMIRCANFIIQMVEIYGARILEKEKQKKKEAEES